MSKKKKGQFPQDQQAPQPAQAATGAQSAETNPAELAAPEAGVQQNAPAVPRTYFLLFWGLIIAAIALAWSLAVFMPGVPEYVIERWIMAILAAALGFLLFVYK